jgi:hypothetical protein
MKNWWQFKQPGPLARVLFVLGFLAVQMSPLFGGRILGAVGAGIAVAGVIACIAERRAWYAVLCAALVYPGLTYQARNWATMPAGARAANIALLLVIGAIVALVMLEALGIVKPHAGHEKSQTASG